MALSASASARSKADLVRAEEAAGKSLGTEERLLAKEARIEEQTVELQERRAAQESGVMTLYAELKKTQSNVAVVDTSRTAMKAKLESTERQLRNKERALADLKIDLAKKLQAASDNTLSESQLQMLEQNARDITNMKAGLQREYKEREDFMAHEIEGVRRHEQTMFAKREAELIEQQQAETASMRAEEQRKATMKLEAGGARTPRPRGPPRVGSITQSASGQMSNQFKDECSPGYQSARASLSSFL